MQKNKILLLSLRWNIIWDSVREIALAKKILKENINSEIYYPCWKIIYELLKDNKYLTPVYIKEFDLFNSTKISKFSKVIKLIITIFKIIKLNQNIEKTIYSGSMIKIRYFAAKIISIILKSKFETKNFQYWKTEFNELFFNEKEKNNINKYLIKNNKKNISICIESTDKNRMWNKDNFIKLIENLKENYNIYLLWIDKEYNKEIIQIFWDSIINLVWFLNIRETSLIIKNSYFFIWNDSWLAHIASWVETNIIVITLENTINESEIYNNKEKTKIKIMRKPSNIELIKEINENYIYSL